MLFLCSLYDAGIGGMRVRLEMTKDLIAANTPAIVEQRVPHLYYFLMVSRGLC